MVAGSRPPLARMMWSIDGDHHIIINDFASLSSIYILRPGGRWEVTRRRNKHWISPNLKSKARKTQTQKETYNQYKHLNCITPTTPTKLIYRHRLKYLPADALIKPQWPGKLSDCRTASWRVPTTSWGVPTTSWGVPTTSWGVPATRWSANGKSKGKIHRGWHNLFCIVLSYSRTLLPGLPSRRKRCGSYV